MATMAQTIVIRTRIISIADSNWLRKPNCSGVNKKFNAKLIQKGRATRQLIFPFASNTSTNIFTPNIISDYMKENGYKNVFQSGIDLNNAFMVVGELK